MSAEPFDAEQVRLLREWQGLHRETNQCAADWHAKATEAARAEERFRDVAARAGAARDALYEAGFDMGIGDRQSWASRR